MDVALGYIFLASAFFIIISMVLMLVRLIGGATLYDRLLAVNSFGTKTDGVDIAILYALMNFIATIAALKFFNYKALTVGLTGTKQIAEEAE